MRIFLIFSFILSWAFSDAHIITYHRFDDARYPHTNISTQNLKEQFKQFKKDGYEVVPLEKLVLAIKNKAEIPNNWIVLTVDDSYKSFYEKGLPIFKEFKYPFTLFVYIEAVEKRYNDFMSFKQIKEVEKYGEIGYHSYSHKSMIDMNKTGLNLDFEKGLKYFEKNLGFKPKYFAYPYGNYNDEVKNIAKSFGFVAIFNQNSGAISNRSELLDLNRIPSVDDLSLMKLLHSKFLYTEFIEPTKYPKDGILKNIIVKVDSNSSKARMHISGLGSREVPIKNGLIDVKINKKLNKRLVRIVINDKLKVSTKIITKERDVK